MTQAPLTFHYPMGRGALVHPIRVGRNPLLEFEKVVEATGGDPSQHREMLRRLNAYLPGEEEYRKDFFDAIEVEDLHALLSARPIDLSFLEQLTLSRFLPFPQTWKFVKDRGKLDDIVADIETGNFDPTSELHLEIEYVRSRRGFSGYRGKFADFRILPFFHDDGSIGGQWGEKEAYSTAQEAVAVLDFIVGYHHASPHPTTVVANRRYGRLFVIDPIEELLAAEGIATMDCYVPSFYYDQTSEGSSNANDVLGALFEKEQNIIVVDGTKVSNAPHGEEIVTRFPAAMWGYINAVKEYNRVHGESYGTRFWAPRVTSEVQVGNEERKLFPAVGQELSRTVTLISAADGWRGSIAFFDDPDEKERGFTSILSSTGYAARPPQGLGDGKQVIGRAQYLISRYVDEILSTR